MLLRTAKTEDKSALYALWAQAFGDGKDTIDAFFSPLLRARKYLGRRNGRAGACGAVFARKQNASR